MYRCSYCSKFLELEEQLGWSEGVALTSIALRKSDHGWKLVAKGRRSGGGGLVSFTEGGSFEQALSNLHDAIRTRTLYWHVDRYPVR